VCAPYLSAIPLHTCRDSDEDGAPRGDGHAARVETRQASQSEESTGASAAAGERGRERVCAHAAGGLTGV
jgi:hypothetical protein